jgi:hypothetical protein
MYQVKSHRSSENVLQTIPDHAIDNIRNQSDSVQTQILIHTIRHIFLGNYSKGNPCC